MHGLWAVHEEGCSAHAGTSHGAQGRTGAATGSDAAVEALRGMTVLVTRTLADSDLAPGVLQGLAAKKEPVAAFRSHQDDAGAGDTAADTAADSAAAFAALRRMALKDTSQDAALQDLHSADAASPTGLLLRRAANCCDCRM